MLPPISFILLLLILSIISIDYVTAAVDEQQAFVDGLMDESLRSHRVQACDGERVTLHCPRNTHIMIETGFYGRVVPESQLCPGRTPSKKGYDSTCDVIQAKSRLSEHCDKKRKCTVYVDHTTFEDDPCPSTSKYLQMSYKCKPISFDGESFCAGTEMQLECREGRRLAVYSAYYGRTARGQAAHCTAPAHFSKDCTKDVLPTVLSKCHAQTGCSLSVSNRLFGRPCPKGVPPYLNILFMCVNEEIFSEEAIKGELPSLQKYSKLLLEGSGSGLSGETLDDDWEKPIEEKKEADEKAADDDFYKKDVVPSLLPSHKIAEHPAPPMFSNDAGYITEDRYSMAHPPIMDEEDKNNDDDDEEQIQMDHNIVGITHDVMVVVQFLKNNKEKVLLCVVLSASLALILLMLACILQQFCGSNKNDKRVRYSIERSQLIAKSNPLLDGPPSLMEMGDIDTETFLRYSLSTPPRSSHYDF